MWNHPIRRAKATRHLTNPPFKMTLKGLGDPPISVTRGLKKVSSNPSSGLRLSKLILPNPLIWVLVPVLPSQPGLVVKEKCRLLLIDFIMMLKSKSWRKPITARRRRNKIWRTVLSCLIRIVSKTEQQLIECLILLSLVCPKSYRFQYLEGCNQVMRMYRLRFKSLKINLSWTCLKPSNIQAPLKRD